MSLKTDIITIMNKWAPEESSETWDNVGLQIDTNRKLENVAITLELNIESWHYIQENSVDFIIVHHPLIFKPLYSIGYNDWSDQILRELIKTDIGLYVSHTNLDRAPDAVSNALVKQYELDISKQSDLSEGYGKIIHTKTPIDFDDLVEVITPLETIPPKEDSINSIAFCGGSGKSFVKDIMQKNIDVYITGELGYHDIQYLKQQKKGVILLGHYQSEVFILETIHKKLNHLPIDIEIIK